MTRPAPADVAALVRRAAELRLQMLEMARRAGGGHLGGAYSIIDVLAALYFRILRHRPAEPDWPARDRVIFSKGHGCLALYTVLAAAGYFDPARLDGFYQDGGTLAGHPERGLAPGVEATTGSLGHGLALAVGLALAAELDGAAHRIFAILSDGECNEGSVWEAAMAGPQFKLDRLTVIVDSNKYESLGRVADIMNIEPLGARWATFGWAVREVDGHDLPAVLAALETVPFEAGKPSAIIAHTIKGKGVSFMENVPQWHYRGPTDEEAAAARRELTAALELA